MIKLRRFFIASASLAIALSATADPCFDLYSLPEAKFTLAAKHDPAGVANTLNQCVNSQSCSTSRDSTLCMQNLYYYDAMATFYLQQATSSSLHAAAPTASANPMTTAAPAPVTPAAPVASSSPTNQPMIIVPNPAADGSNGDSSNNDIYKNIKF